MDLTKLSKQELLSKCEELGITKCKFKNKSELIKIIKYKKQMLEIEDKDNCDINNIEEMDLKKISKQELLSKCKSKKTSVRN
jgi:hypothetical protein